MKKQESLALLGGNPALSAPLRLRHSWGPEALALTKELLDDGAISDFYGGRLSRRFEANFAAAQGVKHGVATNSGTSALHAAYRALGIGPGDEIIIPDQAYVSALSAALQLDAAPVLCDVDPETYTLDPSAMQRCLTSRTKLIVPVHLYGFPADMPAICETACKAGISVLEDCGQGHGGLVGSRPVGGFGVASAWSFYVAKHVTTGEGGMVLTDHQPLADRIRSLCNKGKGQGWWDYRELGYSYTMSELQAAAGLASLTHYQEQVTLRCRIEALYREVLSPMQVFELPQRPKQRTGSAFKGLFRIAAEWLPRIDWFLRACTAENLPVQRGYPALHTIPWIANRDRRAWNLPANSQARAPSMQDLRTSADLSARTFNIATGPGLSLSDAEQIAEGVAKVGQALLRREAD
jgi:perosamine synthetase